MFCLLDLLFIWGGLCGDLMVSLFLFNGHVGFGVSFFCFKSIVYWL